MPPPFELRSRDEKEIKDARSWGRRAKPPAGFARAWTSEHGLEALRNLLDENTGTAGFEVKHGIAGAQTSFDGFRGKRDHHLLLIGDAAGGKTVVSVEGAVDNPFGRTLAEHRDDARRRIGRGQNTEALERMQALTKAIGGWEAGASPRRLKLRFGLFAAVAGATAAAIDEEADQAVFCVHELVTKALKPDKQERNEADLRDFVHEVFGEIVTGDDPAWIAGPLKLSGGSERIPAGMPLYVAKLSTPPATA